jgi:hypothetical protein
MSLRVLAARGGKLERELSPGIERQLFEPLLVRAARKYISLGLAAQGERGRRGREVKGLSAIAWFPLDAVLGEPAAVWCPETERITAAGPDPGRLQATCAAGVGSPFVAALQYDPFEYWRPSQQQPPGALGARPLFGTLLRGSCPDHLMWGRHRVSHLQRVPALRTASHVSPEGSGNGPVGGDPAGAVIIPRVGEKPVSGVSPAGGGCPY